MEALIKYKKIFSIVVIYIFFGCAQAQPLKGNNDELLNSISTYESTKDDKHLLNLMIYGSDNELVLSWFEKNMESDNQVLTYAGLAFFESSFSQWNAKAEKVLLRTLSVNPQNGVANRLGDIYRLGIGTVKNSRKACEMYELGYKINTKSNDNIQYAFCMLEDMPDRDFKKSDIAACEVIKTIAEGYFKFTGTAVYSDAGRAYLFYGDCLAKGKTGQKNIKSAIEWLRNGMLAGNSYAAYDYAEQLEKGVGILRDPKGAVAAYNNAAALGLNLAQNRLGVIYAEGELVPKNMIEAYKWFLIATANGHEPAKDNRIRAESRLSRAEIRSAESSAKQWLKENQ
ncbi:tetratricopeptide repeat protein [Limnohabitans sp.]|jgi:TPR repeat protein|uniref:tetratricopeptide repeat protein n=1 Tax=Limnohabitans sp. TaxID=1907725 RepID=UPI002896669A|nr:tetratricopeptide repeat protein [Limnohabitans sp.]